MTRSGELDRRASETLAGFLSTVSRGGEILLWIKRGPPLPKEP